MDEALGAIDIYLFDQLQRGRIQPGMTILDAGCGGGRNLAYFLKSGFEVFAADANASAMEAVRQFSAQVAPQLPAENFRAEPIEAMTFDAESVDFVISNAVLHFASDEAQFEAMLRRMWQTLKPGGVMFCRLTSSIGIEDRVTLIQGRRYRLPDGSDRFLVDEAYLSQWEADLGARRIDPLKTTVVERVRSMSTWVVSKLN
jgi:tellurite methyltransferase